VTASCARPRKMRRRSEVTTVLLLQRSVPSIELKPGRRATDIRAQDRTADGAVRKTAAPEFAFYAGVGASGLPEHIVLT
jgi:hypothetical protein